MALNQVDPLSLSSTLTNPQGTFELSIHDDEFPTEAFTQKEANLLETQLNDLMASLPSSVLAGQLKEREEVIARTAAYAKQELDGKVFGGINAGDNQVGFSVLRPGHIRADPSDGSSQNDWYYEPSSSGWNDWIGDGSTNNYQVNEDQVSVVLGFTDQDVNTEISGLNVDEFGRNMDMLPHDINDARLMDNSSEQMFVPLPSLVASDNDDIHCRLRHDNVQESQPRFFGITFALGDYLNNEDY